MQVKSEFLQLLLKNKLTDFIASVCEAVRRLFLPPAKLRPQKNVTMFTNRKRVYKQLILWGRGQATQASNTQTLRKTVNVSQFTVEKVKVKKN